MSARTPVYIWHIGFQKLEYILALVSSSRIQCEDSEAKLEFWRQKKGLQTEKGADKREMAKRLMLGLSSRIQYEESDRQIRIVAAKKRANSPFFFSPSPFC